MFPIVSGVAMGQVAGASAPSDLFYKDLAGNGGLQNGTGRFTVSVGRQTQDDNNFQVPFDVPPNLDFNVGVTVNFTGSITQAIGWTLTTLDNGAGGIINNGGAGVLTESGTNDITASINFVAAAQGVAAGPSAYRITAVATNGAGNDGFTEDILFNFL